VTVVEAWITMGLFFVLVGLSYMADRFKNKKTEDEKLLTTNKDEVPFIEYTALEIYKELLVEK